MPQTIYCFTGLGADEQLFSKIALHGFTLKHINYIPPIAAESLPAYAQRLCNQIKEINPILIGVSFGGMLATEAGKQLQAQQTIIISSVKSARYFPLHYHAAHKIQLVKMLPSRLFNMAGAVPNFLFGAETTGDKALLRSYIKSADTTFIKWALQSIMAWNNKTYPQNLLHIHGTEDRIMPLPNKVDYIIKGGGHLMMYNRADEISQLLQNCLTAQP